MMLSAADADLARRDAAVPGLAMLLDPDAFMAALRRTVPDADLGAARATYVKYKPGTNCLAGYRLELERTTIDAHGKAFSFADAFKIGEEAQKRPAVPGPLGNGRIVVEDCAILISVFPDDSKIKALAAITDGALQARTLRQLFPRRPDLWQGRVERLVYKPERRWVGRLMVDGVARAALKVYTNDEYRDAVPNAGLFRSQGALQVAAILGQSDAHRTLAFAWVPDRPLSDGLADPTLDLAQVAMAGAALAALHAQDGARLPRPSRDAVAAALQGEAAFLAHIDPALAGRAAGVAGELVAALARAPALEQPIHGDFHARQVLLGETTATILDVDRALRGDPAADLGNFVADLEREQAREYLSAARVRALTGALFDGYRSARARALPARIELHTAAALFRLAPRCFRYREPNWPESADWLLRRAQEMLKDGVS